MSTDPETKLNNEFTFWLTFFNKSKDKQLEEFEDNMKPLGSFATVESFWNIYQHMKRPYDLPRGSEFFLFKKGIKPLWEDAANNGGGRFFISIKRSTMANKIWEDLLLAYLLTDAAHNAINGVVLNVRTSEVFLSVWTAQLSDKEMSVYRSWIKTALDFPIEQIIDYKKHPNNAQMVLRQENLIKEEIERKNREIELERKKEEDADRKKKQKEERDKKEKNEKDEIEKLANEIEEANNEGMMEDEEVKETKTTLKEKEINTHEF